MEHYSYVLTIDSKIKPLEFNQPTVQEVVENMHKERRLPSISYSTFTTHVRMKSPKPDIEDRLISNDEVVTGASSNQEHSYPSESFALQTNVAFGDELLNSPQGKVSLRWEEPTYTNNVSNNYDVPRKLMSQLEAKSDVGDTFTVTRSLLQAGARDKVKPIPVPPCVVPLTSSSSDLDTSNLSITRTVNKDSSYMNLYPTTPVVHSLMETKNQPPTLDIDSKETLSLSDLIKNHPLLRNPRTHDQTEDQSSSKEKAHFVAAQCFSQRSSSLYSVPVSHSNGQAISQISSPLTSTAVKSPVGIGEGLKDAHSQIQNSADHGIVHAQSTSSPMPSKAPKQKLSSLSTCEVQTTEYSCVVSASMNRAQMLIARNIQELKKLDCEKVVNYISVWLSQQPELIEYRYSLHALILSLFPFKVQKLLDNMNLGQYKQCFHSEGIDGEILAECDEKVLLYELNIHSEIHRDQIMNIITGKQSVTLILSGQGTYNYARHSKH